MAAVFPFAVPTSICRNNPTIYSGVCFLPRAIPGPSSFQFLSLQLAQKVTGTPFFPKKWPFSEVRRGLPDVLCQREEAPEQGEGPG
jgi:hypothetical protein